MAPINIPPAPVKGDIKSVPAAGNNLNVVTSIDPVSDSNLQPYTCINYIICLQGIFPSRN
ncbi:MAG: hypothetical protein IPL65_16185 [Lewinellaceae bacterium]|nr:hypothetical protein [Lewinellaceae bacterium]